MPGPESLILRQTFGLVDQSELLGLLFWECGELVGFESQLPPGLLPGALHRDPLAHGHGPGAGEQAGEAGDDDGVLGEAGAGDAHHQGEVGHEPVVSTEHGGAQGVAADGAVPALQPRDRVAGHARGRSAGDGGQEPGVGALVGAHRRVLGLELLVVHAAVGVLGGGHGRQHGGSAGPAGDPGHHAGAPAGPAVRQGDAGWGELVLPEVAWRSSASARRR